MNRRSILAAYKKKSSHFQTGVTGFKSGNLFTCDLRVMRNLKIVRYSVVLLGFVVLHTKAQNGFCPMCTKECCIVLTCSKPFWGQFWGQICKTNFDLRHSNKCAALVPLRKVDTHITGFSQVKSPTNQYISFILQQEVVRKSTLHHPRTPPLSPRETPRFGLIRSASAWYSSSQILP